CIAYQPPVTAAATNRNTIMRFRAENSMIRSIMRCSAGRCLQLAFRIDEKVAGSHDALSGFQTAENLDAIARLLSNFDCARLEDTVAAIHEHHLPLTRVENGRVRQIGSAHV